MSCNNCADSGWVCENHADRPWDGVSDDLRACLCGGAGMPCPVCNLSDPPSPPTGSVHIWDVKYGWRH